mmetsp:Transcript_43879/g.92311  ORF Transcript_43879/g.92311 Transcript_43879/m.92311 type:complete len:562 (-) Transcript_43879:211-1896(-)|eukprot:CAMPEP_0183739818 /NCGR_PEP_ID=MMETSP0737-20130205/58069_1 /TAXON_ID=385413 /ORGANISM="Thalassiosira miniscula, Strain CCMP1093" /LENGTH=561 /DNA_ID=CAMNT_0025974711 /DNA_START=136 /DNA_END=1821 /DNA_ORIENTATION=+
MTIPAIDPAEVGASGLAWLLISYGYVLYYASNLISEGSDLLLLIPSLAGLVGGVVLPLLGAVPDGAIMLFSGLGDIDKAQETLSVGVGALAGSTIMLLTVPFALSVYHGRVDFSGQDMMPNYKGNPKLRDGGTLSTTGVSLTPEIHHGAKMMMMTTLPYFLIQVPAFFLHGDRQEVSEGEHYWAMAGFIVCMVFFTTYLYTQVKMSNDSAHKIRRMTVIKESLKKGAMSLSGALADQVKIIEAEQFKRRASGTIFSEGSSLSPVNDIDLNPSEEVVDLLKDILSEAFRGYDQDGNGTLSKKEFSLFLTDFHENITTDQLDGVFSQFDLDNDNTIDYDEFIKACYVIITTSRDPEATNFRASPSFHASVAAPVTEHIFNDEGGDEEEQEEVPEDLTSLPPEEQQRIIKRRAFTMLFIGTALVLLFSDPMVDVLSEVAERLEIPAFYVSFILAPLASNASEVIASQYYAAKKTRKTITVALTALEGAASMNNTFCLSIFMALIFFRGLAWQYSAETISIILVQFVMGVWALRDKMSTLTATIVFSLFPLSVLFVALLEYLGLD